MSLDNDIDLTDNMIFSKNNPEYQIQLDMFNKDGYQLPKLFYNNITVEDILSRNDCKNHFDYHMIVNSVLKIQDPDSGYYGYSRGYFCDNCCINLYNTNRRYECQSCFDKRMLENNDLINYLNN